MKKNRLWVIIALAIFPITLLSCSQNIQSPTLAPVSQSMSMDDVAVSITGEDPEGRYLPLVLDQLDTLQPTIVTPTPTSVLTTTPVYTVTPIPTHPVPEGIVWNHLSSETGYLEPPSQSLQQTASLILDVDLDGVNDFVIGIRRDPGPSVVWYRRNTTGWDKYLIDDFPLDIEAGGTFYDIDQDGDLDIVLGGDASRNRVWWWENPYPDYDPDVTWTRREIKNSGENKHHDMVFGDFDGDLVDEFVFWNQGAKKLFLAEIPSNPKSVQSWQYQEIYSWTTDLEHEGLTVADIDGDGVVDLVGGGRWFKYRGNDQFVPQVIDDTYRFTRVSVGQLIEGGAPEVVFVPGDDAGKLRLYETNGNTWSGYDLLPFDIDHGHSLQIADIDNDGHEDVFVAEMRLDGENPDAKMLLLRGDGQGNFETLEISSGYGNHESRVADLDGNGTLDILGKPYVWETPRIDIWLNNSGVLDLDNWERHVIDSDKPWRAVFIGAADINGDQIQDIITGGWWYQNPGSLQGAWQRRSIGSPLNNYAAVFDFDLDEDMDILGTEGQGSDVNSSFVWAEKRWGWEFFNIK